MKKNIQLLAFLLLSTTAFAQPALQSTDNLWFDGGNTFFKRPLSDLATLVLSPTTISPSQITANQNDYSPTGWSTATLVRLDFDNSGKVITGFAAFSGTKTIVNVGSNYGVIAVEHPSSSAANRVAGTMDYLLPPNASIVLTYDATSSRCRVASSTFDISDLGGTHKGMYFKSPPISITSGDNSYMIVSAAGSGATAAAKTPGANLPRGVSLPTGTTSSGRITMGGLKAGEFVRWGDAHIIGFGTIYIPTLSDGTERFTADFGLSFINTNLYDLADRSSVGIRYADDVNSGKWSLYNIDHSQVLSSTDSGVTVAANTVYQMVVVVDKALSESRFFINGTYVGRVTANMPAANISTGVRAGISKSLGSTSREVVVSNLGFGFITN